MALLAACSGGGGGSDGDGGRRGKNGGSQDGPSPGASSPKRLWKAELPRAEHRFWLSDGVLAVGDGTTVRGLDAATGDQRWSLRLPGNATAVCRMSDEPNSRGIGGVLFTSSADGPCDTVGAVDLADGTLLWSTPDADTGFTSVSVGDTVLTAGLSGGDVRRFAADSGAARPALRRSDGVQAARSGTFHNATHVVVGFGAPGERPAYRSDSYGVYDAESGKRLWGSDTRPDLRPHRIITGAPLTLELTDNGRGSVAAVDSRGRPVRTFGGAGLNVPEGPTTGVLLPRGIGPLTGEGVLVTGSADESEHGSGADDPDVEDADAADPHLYAYDLKTGKRLWKRPRSESAAFAIRGDTLLASTPAPGDGSHRSGAEVDSGRRLVSYSLREGRRTELGELPRADRGAVPFAGDDERVYAYLPREGITAYRI